MTDGASGITSGRTALIFIAGRACSDTLLCAVSRAYGRTMKLEERAAMPLAGGIQQHGYQCGMLWGATLAAGAQAHRLFGPGPRAEATAIVAAGRLVESFRAANGEINCLELTDIDKDSSALKMLTFFVLRGGTIGCIRRAARYAPEAFREIESVLSGTPVPAPDPPVSCAAELARRMGESDLHATMAAGLAGGIGLCGGACGALGAAVWILGLRAGREPGGKVEWKTPRAAAVIDRFVRSSGFEFECSKIVGRTFAGVDDHAAHLRDGGCAKILEALATG